MSAINAIKKIAGASAIGIGLRGMLFVAICASNPALAEVAQSPLFLANQLSPNIMFTLDDSGSMDWEYLPDDAPQATFGNRKHELAVAKYRTSSLNRIFYDPAIRYRPWQKSDTTYYDNSVPTGARSDPRNTATVNLIQTGKDSNNVPNHLAFYYNYNGNGTENIANYSRVFISDGTNTVAPSSTYPKAADRTDCTADSTGATCSYGEEITNFANWYTYYRKRTFTAIAGVSQAFNELDGSFRVGYGRINSGSQSVDGVSTATVRLGVRDFTSTARDNWFAALFAAPASGYTPLRRAMDDVGKYFSRADEKGPWAQSPGVSKGTEYACRKSFHILMTDGYWNSTAASTTGTSNGDSTNGPSIDGAIRYTASTAGSYYNSSYSNTLADVAMHYWKKDLRTDLANKVPVSPTNPAFWQHVAQYTVGLGVDGTLSYPGDEAALKAGEKTWPDPGSSGGGPEAVDDLWHAAVNGRGKYFSAKNPAEFRDGLLSALTDIKVQNGAASSVTTSSNRMESGGKAYVPSFQSGIWLGHLKAYSVDANGGLAVEADWDAANKLPAWDARTIVTWDGSAGKDFVWANLTAAQKNHLVSENVLNYLRGNDTLEKPKAGGIYRSRATKLGDIVNSSPLYAGKSDRGYKGLIAPEEGEEDSYKIFVSAKASRTPMIYVGANDGMLHGFNANTGVEVFAFIPNSVYPNLKSLSATDYVHKYFVDGHITEGDAYVSDAWKNILLGSTGAGAKSIFAVDITAPTSLGAGSVMWEKTDSGDSDMGYVMGQVEIERMANGDWAAIHGNGYDSADKKAVLYIRNAATGAVIKKIDTGIGGAAIPNGLSAPIFVRDDERRVIAAYAGDLRGNLWKFDLSGSTSESWKVAYAGSPLFVAKNLDNQVQPITHRPEIGEHPNGGYVIGFGTGKYYEDADRSSTARQSVYGIWDKPEAGVVTGERATILQQQILTTATGGATLTKTIVNWGAKRGWFIDLSLSVGERVIADPKIEGDILWLITLTPVTDPCSMGGESRLMGVSYVSGGAVTRIFDTNNDGLINTSDAELSSIDVGGAISDFRFVRVGDENKIIINKLDGTTDNRKTGVSGRPFRTWRLLTDN